MTHNQPKLLCEIQEFCDKLQNGEYLHPLDLWTELQRLSDKQWRIIEEMYSPSIRIE